MFLSLSYQILNAKQHNNRSEAEKLKQKLYIGVCQNLLLVSRLKKNRSYMIWVCLLFSLFLCCTMVNIIQMNEYKNEPMWHDGLQNIHRSKRPFLMTPLPQ